MISSPDFTVTRGLSPKGIQRVLHSTHTAFDVLTAYIKTKTQLKCRTCNQIWKGCYIDKHFTEGNGLIPGQRDRGWWSCSPSPACTRLTFSWAAQLHRPSGLFTGFLYIGKSTRGAQLKGIWNKPPLHPPSPAQNNDKKNLNSQSSQFVNKRYAYRYHDTSTATPCKSSYQKHTV